ncbi:MAG TPA: DNA starvation/stationary phase protection protein [Magnetospirillaceae bacterium]|nr:DNA starvation/stationary phase protection protein [Magnetospirillaceae bacterium]
MNATIIERLKRHTADSLVLWVKFHNLHWNLRGSQFKGVHELTEAYYDGLAEEYDAFAERLVQLKAKPPVTLKASLELSAFPELGRDSFQVPEVLSIVRADFEKLLSGFRQTCSLASGAGDVTTEAMLVDSIAKLEKQIWMLDASLDT